MTVIKRKPVAKEEPAKAEAGESFMERDPVSRETLSGKTKWSSVYDRKIIYFANEHNKLLFDKDPRRYSVWIGGA